MGSEETASKKGSRVWQEALLSLLWTCALVTPSRPQMRPHFQTYTLAAGPCLLSLEMLTNLQGTHKGDAEWCKSSGWQQCSAATSVTLALAVSYPYTSILATLVPTLPFWNCVAKNTWVGGEQRNTQRIKENGKWRRKDFKDQDSGFCLHQQWQWTLAAPGTSGSSDIAPLAVPLLCVWRNKGSQTLAPSELAISSVRSACSLIWQPVAEWFTETFYVAEQAHSKWAVWCGVTMTSWEAVLNLLWRFWLGIQSIPSLWGL